MPVKFYPKSRAFSINLRAKIKKSMKNGIILIAIN